MGLGFGDVGVVQGQEQQSTWRSPHVPVSDEVSEVPYAKP